MNLAKERMVNELIGIILLADFNILKKASFGSMACDLHNRNRRHILQVSVCGKGSSSCVNGD